MKSLDNADILFCDSHVLAAIKPAGMATQPDFVDAAKAWIKKKFNKPGAVFLEPIHRLDKPAAGIVIFARNSKSLTRLNEAMRARKIRKFYRAEVEGQMKARQGELKHHLLHGEYRAVVHPSGKEAILKYRVISEGDQTSVLEIELETGRYHQIRAQLAASGHPIVGDEKYGSKIKNKNSIALCHTRIEFTHPVRHEKVTIEWKA